MFERRGKVAGKSKGTERYREREREREFEVICNSDGLITETCLAFLLFIGAWKCF